jgi:geranylgeranyl diphosphate synthase, type I
MLRDNDPNRNKLRAILDAKSREALDRFGEVAILGFTDPQVISIFNDVRTYWKDVYRPALITLSCETVQGDPYLTADASLMITLTAAGMGIHDDIIDKSEISHFRRTILGKHGIDKALLVGDLMIIKGFAKAQSFLQQKNITQEQKSALIDAFQGFFLEIYEGALMDISCRKNLNTDPELYSKIIWKLTADGEVCSKIGGILGGGTQEEIQALSEFGHGLGFVHHLSEEVKDSMNEEGGLPHRLEFESVPLPILYAAKSSDKAFAKIDEILKQSSISAHVSDLVKTCWESRAFNYVYEMSKQNLDRAVLKLRALKPSPARDTLVLMIQNSFRYVKLARDIEDRYVGT